jgi:hypothetical protein
MSLQLLVLTPWVLISVSVLGLLTFGSREIASAKRSSERTAVDGPAPGPHLAHAAPGSGVRVPHRASESRA